MILNHATSGERGKMESGWMGSGGGWAVRNKLYLLLELFRVVMSPRRATKQAWRYKRFLANAATSFRPIQTSCLAHSMAPIISIMTSHGQKNLI